MPRHIRSKIVENDTEKGNKTVVFFQLLVSDYRRQVGNGRVGLGIDHYLLDNRNRTQKWDE